MTPNETFVVVDWMVDFKKVEDGVVFVGNQADAKAFQASRDAVAGYKGSVEVMTFADFCYDVRREAECDVH